MAPIRQVLSSKGKGIRPAIVFEAARCGSHARTESVHLAANAVELLHVATMTHDDVIDRGELRRGVPTVVAKYGSHIAVTVGVWLLGRVAELFIECGPGVLARASESITRMCDGQLLEARDLFNTERTIEDYRRTIEGKTAALFALSAWLGGKLGGAPPTTTRALERYGRQLGIAYQIADDLRDLVHEQRTTKHAGDDLRQGIYTLPILYAIQAEPELRTILAGALTTTDVARVIEITTETGALACAHQHCQDYATAAQNTLTHIQPHPQPLLQKLPQLILDICDEVAKSTSQSDFHEHAPHSDAFSVPISHNDFLMARHRLAGAASAPPFTSILASHLADEDTQLATLLANWRSEMLETLPAEFSLSIGAPGKDLASRADLTLAAIVVLANRAVGGEPDERIRRAALASELLRLAHIAFSLVAEGEFDDRGHLATAVAVLAGDTCLTRAMEMAIPAGVTVSRAISVTSRRMCDGQLLGARELLDPERTIEDYRRMIEGKTAALFALSAWLGGKLGGAPPTTTRALERYGRQLGMAYQIAEDLKDLEHEQPTAKHEGDTATDALARAHQHCHDYATAAQNTLTHIQLPPQPLLQKLPQLILGLSDEILATAATPARSG